MSWRAILLNTRLQRARRDIHLISKPVRINREKAFPYSGNFGVSDL